MSVNRCPQRKDKVNDTRRKPNANGFVILLTYDNGEPDEVIVRFDDGIVHYEYSEFEYAWTENYGGCFVLNHDH